MAVVIKETKAARFLGPILVGALTFGILSVVLFAGYAAFVAWRTHDPHPPFELSLAMLPLMGVAAALAFMGGLVGIVLRGIYVMAGRWADRLLLFIAPLALAAASFGVERVKYGGTVLSHTHGWPYPLARYAVGDILDGTSIGIWHINLGTLFSNPIRDYLFYFMVLAGLYLLVRALLEATGRRAEGHWLTTGVLFGVATAGAVGLLSYMTWRGAYVWNGVTKANHCVVAEDCVIVRNHGAFGCAITANKDEARRVETMLMQYPDDFRLTSCGEATPTCEAGKCRAQFR
jgi:hypothetical protein